MSSAGAAPEAAERTTWRGALLAVLVGLVLLLAVAEGLLRLIEPHWDEFYSGRFMQSVVVPGHGALVLGRPGFDGWFAQNNGDFRVHIRLNEAGLREPEPVTAAADRVWVVGDSMTFGWGVPHEAMYSTVAAAKSGRAAYNVASPGTNVCGYQALVARMLRDVRPAAVIVGLVIENDIQSYNCAAARDPAADIAGPPRFNLTEFKLFLTAHSALYNVLAVSLKRVPAVVRLLTGIGLVKRPQEMRPHAGMATAEKEVESTARELVRLRAMLPPQTPFAVLVIPARFDIRDREPFYVAVRERLLAALAARGIATIDPTDAFRAAGFTATHFAHDGHWSAAGHAVAAEAVARWLRDLPFGRR